MWIMSASWRLEDYISDCEDSFEAGRDQFGDGSNDGVFHWDKSIGNYGDSI